MLILNYCLAPGKSSTGIFTGCLHFVNKTPVDWYSKKQATVETATYGSEFVAAKTVTEQTMADFEVSWGTHWLKILFIW